MTKKKYELDHDFVERLAEVVEAAGGQNAFARAVGISQSTVGQYLAGSEPNRRTLVAMARAANRSVSWLASGEQAARVTNNSAEITATNCRDVVTQSDIRQEVSNPGSTTIEVSERERKILVGLREYFSPAEVRALEQRIEQRQREAGE